MEKTKIKTLDGKVLYSVKGTLIQANLEGANLKGTGLVQVVGLGSAGRCTTWDTINGKVYCGCFSGAFEEFEARVKDTHENNELYRTQYLAALAMIRSIQVERPISKDEEE